ncbi:MAG: S8 family peptidase [Myxococcota bacterium]
MTGLEPPPEASRWLVQIREAAPGASRKEEENLRKQQLLAGAPSVQLVHLLAELPMLVVDATRADVERLRASPDVVALFSDSSLRATDASSFPFIGHSSLPAPVPGGLGAAVAVLDTGVDFTHPDFGACAAPGPTCRVVVSRDFAPDDGQRDDLGHGSNVAGIIAGLAPQARILSLDVFGPAGTAQASHVIAAIDWVLAQRTTWGVVALNLSFGNGVFTTPCARDVFAAPLARARAAGIVPVAASGNDRSASGVSSPACAPAAVSVGALYDERFGAVTTLGCTDATTSPGAVACYSNAADFLTLWAPGSFVAAAGRVMSGTSQAAPHVAAALALLAEQFPADDVETRVLRLTADAPLVRDPRSGLSRPRLWLPAALAPCSASLAPRALTLGAEPGQATVTLSLPAACTWSLAGLPAWLTASPSSGRGSSTLRLAVAPNTGPQRTALVSVGGTPLGLTQREDTTAPTGNITLPALSASRTVVVSATASDAVGEISMCLSTASTCPTTGWGLLAKDTAFTLPSGDGPRTVRAWFRDTRGNSSTAAATTTLDTLPPADGKVAALRSAADLVVQWSGFAEATTRIVRYRVAVAAGTATPAARCTGLATETTATALTVASPLNVSRVRVCAVDAAGNVSTGAVATVR